MVDDNLPQVGGIGFEGLKKTNDYGAEYWSARDLQPLLGYTQWRRFENAIKKAITSCEQSGNDPSHHFAGAGKMVGLGSGSERKVRNFHLSRFACYLIAQNGDPRKPEIANAQKYFAIQTRRQELSDQAAADLERLELRKQTSEEFKALSGAARHHVSPDLSRSSICMNSAGLTILIPRNSFSGNRCRRSPLTMCVAPATTALSRTMSSFGSAQAPCTKPST